VNPSDASLKQYSALPSESIGTTIPDSTPSVFSTRMSSSTSSATPSVGVTSTGAGIKTAADTTGLTGGEIAGIAVSAVAAVAIIAVSWAIIFLALHGKKSRPLTGNNNSRDLRPPGPQIDSSEADIELCTFTQK
jgi:hypothetical protein